MFLKQFYLIHCIGVPMEGVALKVTRRVRVLMEKVKASQPTENFE